MSGISLHDLEFQDMNLQHDVQPLALKEPVPLMAAVADQHRKQPDQANRLCCILKRNLNQVDTNAAENSDTSDKRPSVPIWTND